jgi:hypothetical protein
MAPGKVLESVSTFLAICSRCVKTEMNVDSSRWSARSSGEEAK